MPRLDVRSVRRGAALITAACLFAACGSNDTPATTTTPAATAPVVSFNSATGGTATLSVEIADTPEERSRGLMNRATLAPDAGMLFTWPEDSESGFWMKDTLIPLSIAFIDASGTIVDIQDMQARDETLHYSAAPYRYAVEANQGWFAEDGITAGDEVTLPDGLSN